MGALKTLGGGGGVSAATSKGLILSGRYGARFNQGQPPIQFPVNAGNVNIQTDLDLTIREATLKFSLEDITGSDTENSRAWPIAELDLDQLRQRFESNRSIHGFIWNHDRAYVTVSILSLNPGLLQVRSFTRNAQINWIEMHISEDNPDV